MTLNPIIAARERKDGTQPGRAGSPLPAVEGDKMFALPASSRRRARSVASARGLASRLVLLYWGGGRKNLTIEATGVSGQEYSL
jgi:hypothetical protein